MFGTFKCFDDLWSAEKFLLNKSPVLGKHEFGEKYEIQERADHGMPCDWKSIPYDIKEIEKRYLDEKSSTVDSK